MGWSFPFCRSGNSPKWPASCVLYIAAAAWASLGVSCAVHGIVVYVDFRLLLISSAAAPKLMGTPEAPHMLGNSAGHASLTVEDRLKALVVDHGWAGECN